MIGQIKGSNDRSNQELECNESGNGRGAAADPAEHDQVLLGGQPDRRQPRGRQGAHGAHLGAGAAVLVRMYIYIICIHILLLYVIMCYNRRGRREADGAHLGAGAAVLVRVIIYM
jgi:hypothetical protein